MIQRTPKTVSAVLLLTMVATGALAHKAPILKEVKAGQSCLHLSPREKCVGKHDDCLGGDKHLMRTNAGARCAPKYSEKPTLQHGEAKS